VKEAKILGPDPGYWMLDKTRNGSYLFTGIQYQTSSIQYQEFLSGTLKGILHRRACGFQKVNRLEVGLLCLDLQDCTTDIALDLPLIVIIGIPYIHLMPAGKTIDFHLLFSLSFLLYDALPIAEAAIKDPFLTSPLAFGANICLFADRYHTRSFAGQTGQIAALTS